MCTQYTITPKGSKRSLSLLFLKKLANILSAWCFTEFQSLLVLDSEIPELLPVYNTPSLDLD